VGPAHERHRQRSRRRFAIAAAPKNDRVYVFAQSEGSSGNDDYLTLAHPTDTGTVLWKKRYNGPGNDYDSPYQVVFSPDGTKVFVVGESMGTGSDSDYATIAYSTGTGSVQWKKRCDGAVHGDDSAWAVAVNSKGTRVFVTGQSEGSGGTLDFATVGYSTL
jgi:DNA-binding beta-propeller fold protein YncE